jgi:hypothetical protein
MRVARRLHHHDHRRSRPRVPWSVSRQRLFPRDGELELGLSAQRFGIEALGAALAILFTGERSMHVSYAEIGVSIPPNHKPGEIEWSSQTPGDPARNFVTDHEMKALAADGVGTSRVRSKLPRTHETRSRWCPQKFDRTSVTTGTGVANSSCYPGRKSPGVNVDSRSNHHQRRRQDATCNFWYRLAWFRDFGPCHDCDDQLAAAPRTDWVDRPRVRGL